jgi:hypothetical protein
MQGTVRGIVLSKMDDKAVWKVGYAKVGSGHVARREPNGGLDESPTFATPQEVYAWLAAKGLKPSDDNEDHWIKAE